MTLIMRKLFLLSLVVILLLAVACTPVTVTNEFSEAEPGEESSPAAAQSTESATPESTVESNPSSGSTQSSAPASSVPLAPPAASVPSTSAAPAPSVGARGGVLRRLWSDPPTLDPHLTSDTTSATIVVEVYSGLITIGIDLRLAPDIAESWDISDDGTVYTFHIRPEAKFHNGKSITAADFVYSINRAASPRTASPTADTYLGDIVGVRDVLDGIADTVSGVQAIDEKTLKITIDAPKAYFLAKLTYPTAFVLDQSQVESDPSWLDAPNGSGPFKLKEYKIGERIILERFDEFYLEPAMLDEVHMNLVGGQAMAMYENDEIDITGVGLFDLERLKDPNEPMSKELKVSPPGFSVTYIGLNPNEAPFDDLKFRQALNYAIDKDVIANEVYSGRLVPAHGILPPGFPGYNPNLVGLRFDPELAKQLLAESSYADPDSRPRITITVPGTGGTIGLDLEVIQEMWIQNLGVEVEIQQGEGATYLQDLNRRKFQALAGLSWQADYPDPQDFLDILFHSESETNHGGYSNSEVDALLEAARVEIDVSKRVKLYNDAEKMIVEDAAWVPLWYTGDRFLLLKPYIKGYALTPMTLPKLRHVYIEGK